MATTLTTVQITEQATFLSRTNEYLDLYRLYKKEFPISSYYDAVREDVIVFIETFNSVNYPSSNRDDAAAVLAEYDNTYGRDDIFNTLDTYISQGLDPDDVILRYFRAVADGNDYFKTLAKQLPALKNPFEVPEEFLGTLGKTIGAHVPYALPESIKRFRVARSVPYYKIKGTHLSFQFLLRSLGFNARVIELWTDWDMEKFQETPDVYPILPDGSPNPAYDPENLTDGLVKYKSSFFDIDAESSTSDSLPIDIIESLLLGIEEVRPITRTLRLIFYTVNFEDDFPELDDEFDVGTITGDFRDEASWNDYMWAPCWTYGCDGTGATYAGGYYYDYEIYFDDPSGTPNCDEYYDNAIQPYYDGVAIADFSGLSSPLGTPFVYSGVYDGTVFFTACEEADTIEGTVTGTFEDEFVDQQILYDGQYYFNDDDDIYYDGDNKRFPDVLTISLVPVGENPLLYDTVLWLDAMDPSSLVISGGKVSSWADKSGNNSITFAQTNAANQPEYEYDTIGLYPTVVMSEAGIQRYMSGTFLPNDVGDWTLFAILADTSNSSYFIQKILATGNPSLPDLSFYNRGQVAQYETMEDKTGTRQASTDSGGNGNKLLCFEATTNGQIYRNGVAITSGVWSYTAAGLDGPMMLGADDTSPISFLNGKIGELFLVRGSLTAGERQDLEGYLAWKWSTW